MLISYSIGSGGIRHNLDALAKNYLSHNALSFKEIAGTGKNQKVFNEIDISTASKYAAEDADITLRLWKLLKPKLAEDRLSSVYETIERPLAKIIMEMEKHGVSVDEKILNKLSEKFASKIKKIEEKCFEVVVSNLTLDHPSKLARYYLISLV